MNDLPKSWKVEPFNKVAHYATGRTPARANQTYWAKGPDQVPWVTISDMEEYGTITDTAESVSAIAFRDVFRGRTVPAGTLLMSFKLTIGRVATLGVPACHNEAIISIYPREDVDQRYLGYFLSQVDYTSHQDRQIKGNTLNQSKIDQIQVALPPSKEQSKIADVLDRCRQGVKIGRAAEETAQQLKRAVMRELFTRGLRDEPLMETEFGPIPAIWLHLPLNDCAVVQTGAAKGRKLSDSETVEVPYLRVANVQDGHLDLKEMKTIKIRRTEIERYRLAPGDVVLTEGGDFDKLGRGFIWRGELDLCVHQNHVFAVRTTAGLLPEFFAYLAQSAYGKAYFLKVAHKTTNLACINSTKLKAFPVAYPKSLDEQREIVSILDTLDRKIKLHQERRILLENLFKALLHKVMTGEISVANLDLSALSATSTQREAVAV